MARKSKAAKAAAIQAAADYITAVIDGEPWEARLSGAAYCRQCPARQGLVLDGDEIEHVCSVCPLRPYMMAVADLVLRKRRKEGRA